MSLLAYIGDLPGLVERRISWFVEEYRPRWLYVMFSGGKDSSAVLAAAASCCRDMVVAVYNHIVGQTHALNAEAALGVAKKLGLRVRRVVVQGPHHLTLTLAREPPSPPELLYLVVRSYRGGLDYWSAVRRYGFPAPAERMGKGIRWCCAEFKEKWWNLLPPNGTYRGRPARFIIVGVKAADSPYRRRRWKGKLVQVWERREPLDVALAPLSDLSDEDVWALLRHYGLYDAVKKQYTVFGHSPNCTLCPLMSLTALRQTVRHLPTGFLHHVLTVLREVRKRYQDGTFSARRIDEWIKAIEEELKRRNELAETETTLQVG